jgi:hypothetical protein
MHFDSRLIESCAEVRAHEGNRRAVRKCECSAEKRHFEGCGIVVVSDETIAQTD